MNIVGAIILGLLFGSLGSVLLVRLSEKVDKETIKSILRGRSQCPHCQTTLHAHNLIPLLSFIWQGGKCQHCRQSISPLYPILEIGSAIVFVLSFLAFQDKGISVMIFWTIINWLFFLLIVYDIMRYELHVPLWMAVSVLLIGGSVVSIDGLFVQSLLSMCFFVIGFGIIYLGARRYAKARYGASEGLGQGDVYLSATIGSGIPFVLSYHFIPRGLSGLVNTFLLFIVLSSGIGIILRLSIKGITRLYSLNFWGAKIKENTQFSSQKQFLSDKVLIPFIPAMIIGFWILLWKSDFFISLLFPLG